MPASIASFARLLDDYTEVLEPFIESSRRGGLHWNGSEYAPTTEDRVADPYALSWWSTLRTISALVSSQPCLTGEQIEYLQRELFGGMGSLNDFSLDTKRWGEKAKVANEQLGKIRHDLYSCFQTLRPVAACKT
jgi:hypothetical protein